MARGQEEKRGARDRTHGVCFLAAVFRALATAAAFGFRRQARPLQSLRQQREPAKRSLPKTGVPLLAVASKVMAISLRSLTGGLDGL